MQRTQIYLTETEQVGLTRLAEQTGKKKSEIIREAVDSMLAKSTKQSRNQQMQKARGIWGDRNDDFLTELRQEANRKLA